MRAGHGGVPRPPVCGGHPQPALREVMIEGDRVVLSPPRPQDAPAAFRLLAGRHEILRWLEWDGPAGEEELARRFGRWSSLEEEVRAYLLAVRVPGPSGEYAGSLGMRFAGHAGVGQLGYWLGVPFQGRGLMTEAVGLAAHLAFGHLRAAALTARVFAGHEASRRVLLRNGFARAGEVDERGDEHFALLRAGWERLPGRPRPRSVRVEAEPDADAGAQPGEASA